MEKLFKKDETLFAILWIVIYVIGFSNADIISETIGMPKAITACFGLVLSALLFIFIRKNLLFEYFGLCGFRGSLQDFLYFIPLVLISSVNLWNGLTLHYDIPTSILNVVSMCFVGFLEEVIFRGFLFKSMCRSNLRFAIIVSSLTFGMGHIVNLLLGEPLFDTLLQLVYASAIGFCYTSIFLVGKSILPCIISHALVNSLSTFAVEPSNEEHIFTTVFITALSVGYGIWLLYFGHKSQKTCTE